MAIGERIRFFRNLKGTAQYESGSRTPKSDLTNNLANVCLAYQQVL